MHLDSQTQYSGYPSILALDPGCENLGLCFLEFCPNEKRILMLDAWTMVASKLPKSIATMIYVNERFARTNALARRLATLLREKAPTIVAHELAYWNPKRPLAFEAMIESITSIRTTCANYDEQLPVVGVRSSIAKACIKAKGNKGKEHVLPALSKLKDVTEVCEVSLLDEHSLDAVAIAYAVFKYIIEGKDIMTDLSVKSK